MRQANLFFEEESPEKIPGLNYFAGYISGADEKILLEEIDRQPWLSDLKRRVQHYGYKYDYKARGVARDSYLGPLPPWLSRISEKLYRDKIFPMLPDQIIVNEYIPGQGISAHIDCVPCFGDTVASLSVGSGCVMEFSNSKKGRIQDLFLEQRSLVVLSDLARYEWMHAIPARKSDIIGSIKIARQRRVSLTFRNVIVD